MSARPSFLNNDSYYGVLLPNGQNVDIMSESGADTFLDVNGALFLKANLEQVEQCRSQLARRNLGAQQRRGLQETLVRVYVLFGCVADHSSPGKLAEKVPREHLELLVDHICKVFSELTEAETWKRTGVLSKYDQELLEACMPLQKHSVFVRLMTEKKPKGEDNGLTVLAKLCAARSDAMFGAPVADALLGVVNNSVITLQIDNMDNEKIFKRIESTGILAQAFRAITVPPLHNDNEHNIHLRMFDWLAQCPKVVRKKLKKGTPTGDVLDAVIQGTDGGTNRRPAVMERLRSLQKTSEMANYHTPNDPTGDREIHFCRQCNKSPWDLPEGNKLMACARCKNTFYCSRECQVADWKSHKASCQTGMAPSRGNQQMALAFVQRNYFQVLNELWRVMRQRNVSKQELLLEIDFYKEVGSSQPSPAHRNVVKVGVTKDYIEGSRPAEPDWFYKGTDVYENNVQQTLAGLRDHSSRMTKDHLLILIRHADHNSGVYRLQLRSEETRLSIMSDEVVQAFGTHNDAVLRRYWDQDMYKSYQRQRGEQMEQMRERMSRLFSAQGGDERQGFLDSLTRMAQEAHQTMQSEEYLQMVREAEEEEEDSGDDEDLDLDNLN